VGSVMTDLAILLNQAFAALKEEMHAEMAQAGYDDLGSSFGYVFRLLEHEPRNLSQVAASLGMTPQGALKIVNDMLEKGYLQRRDDPSDGRTKLLVLTQRARKAMACASGFQASVEQALVDECGKQKVSAMRSVLAALAARGGAGRPARPV
jgi:DNA-binding MarR family transcriptional regulator